MSGQDTSYYMNITRGPSGSSCQAPASSPAKHIRRLLPLLASSLVHAQPRYPCPCRGRPIPDQEAPGSPELHREIQSRMYDERKSLRPA